jgi:hypothetical protein
MNAKKSMVAILSNKKEEKLKKTFVTVLLSGLLFISCLSGKVDYSPPSQYPLKEKSVIIEKPKELVWKKIMANVSNSFFVINNLDKESGFINISYTGPPCNYVDCGWINSEVSNARGKRTYSFAGCTEYKQYEIANPQTNFLGIYNRTMKLEGRINILVQEEEASRTRVSANVRYLVTKSINIQGLSHDFRDSRTDTINFDTNGYAAFPGENPSSCRPNHKLEEDVLKMAIGN